MQDDNQRRLFIEGMAQGVRNTVQLYVPTEDANRREWPLDQGDTYRGMVLPSGCILLWCAGEPPELPMTLEEPDPKIIPWPISSMGAPPPSWTRLRHETRHSEATDTNQPNEQTAESEVSAETTD